MLTDPLHWFLLLLAAFCIGVSKAGFSGISLISVFVLAEVFGPKASLGVALPLLVVADLTVYPAFRKYGSWAEVWIILWPAIIGGAAAYYFLSRVDDLVMRPVIGWIILSMVLMQLWRKWQPEVVLKVGQTKGFGVVAGLAGGVATMLANAAGPIQQMYLLTKGYGKMELIGVGARFFLVINLIKLPFMMQLNILDETTLIQSAIAIPVLIMGVFIGKFFLQRIPQKWFEGLIVVFALLASLKLLLF